MIFSTVVVGGTQKKIDISFTGVRSEVITSTNGDWEFSILTSGKLIFNKAPGLIDVFLVGGGGSGGTGKGGGGGYTLTKRGIAVERKMEYDAFIGDGGVYSYSTNDAVNAGGTTSIFGYAAKGGNASGKNDGGCGGGGYGYEKGGDGGTDGKNGGEGFGYRYPNDDPYAGNPPIVAPGQNGKGQGTTTRAFGEANGLLCAGGGGGRSTTNHCGVGGVGGGGNASADPANPHHGTDNLGGGGGSLSNGGCGLIIIRNHRGGNE